MRLLSLATLVLACALVLCWSSPAQAQVQKPDSVDFKTKDLVELHGAFYPSKLGKKAPTVLMLHRITTSSEVDGWDTLAKDLQAKGCAVLTFDFRGHGQSTNVPKEFWAFPENARNRKGGAPNPTKLPETIQIKDFNTSYYPVLANDITAAKAFLDAKNDAGECNSGNLILLGVGDGATLGLLWLASEWARYEANFTVFPPKFADRAEGKHVACAIWVSMDPKLGSRAAPISTWLKLAGVQNNVPMAFIYGADERESPAQTNKAWLEVLKPDPKKPYTRDLAIKNTKLTAEKLLGGKLATSGDIVTYVTNFTKDNDANNYETKDFVKNSYVWKFGNLPPVEAKTDKDRTMNMLPLARIMP